MDDQCSPHAGSLLPKSHFASICVSCFCDQLYSCAASLAGREAECRSSYCGDNDDESWTVSSRYLSSCMHVITVTLKHIHSDVCITVYFTHSTVYCVVLLTFLNNHNFITTQFRLLRVDFAPCYISTFDLLFNISCCRIFSCKCNVTLIKI